MSAAGPASELRWAADAYEQAQAIRIQTGERIRAVIDGRDPTGSGSMAEDAAAVLRAIRSGKTDGPVPILGRTYRRFWEQEQESARFLADALPDHPAWAWLRRVRGAGPTLSGKLLSRLNLERAPTPSAFWAYCGLATVPGKEYRCPACGRTAAFPVSHKVSGAHRTTRGTPCRDRLRPARGPESGVRVAQPPPRRGERAAYDRLAKKTCYLLGVSFLRVGGPYADLYRRERERLAGSRPGWSNGHLHMAALRKTQKMFLAHLWIAWRRACGLTTCLPYAHDVQRRSGWLDPSDMLSPEPSTTGSGSALPRAAHPRSRAARPAAIPSPHAEDTP